MPRPRLDHVRKSQILTAAADVLSERGYANTRVVDIAKAAGTSPAAILYWFDGKDGLLAQALVLREQEFHDRYTVEADTVESASDQLRILIEAMLHHYDWGLWMELTVRALRDQTAAAERDRIDRRWRAALRNVIRMGQEGGEFDGDDPDETMFVLAALLDGMAPLLAVKAKGVTPDRVERTWLAEASRLLGPGFDASPLRRTR
ncbi:MAG: TetR/AcrR family transcriptional regulator [Actinobacteria bacterium]|nr:TetR/AcrR family transcriptional regulator [Actinomycetota bacterium]